MQLHPILSAMRRNKVGAVLIMLQMAVTLAILCNALFIIQQRLAAAQRPTGADEANVLVIDNQWVGEHRDVGAQILTDLTELRALSGVVDATNANTYPLSDGGMTEGCSIKPDQAHTTTQCAVYMFDEHGLAALGLKLVAGRPFEAGEMQNKTLNDVTPPTAAIVTRALANKLFPGESAVGRELFAEGFKHRTPIVGVVERLQVPWVAAGAWGSTFNDMSVIEPFRYTEQSGYYILRVQPGQMTRVIQAAQKKLIELNRGRVIAKVRSLSDARIEAYQDDRGLAVILAAVCAALLAVTAFGIVGLTSYWVAQRRKHIGIRRALGATRRAIMQYFHTENLIIASSGAALGVALALLLNTWMVNNLAMQRLHVGYALMGAVIVLLLGQAAVFWPALRAASIPPALATRSV